MKVAILFDRFGPYHIARLKGAATYVDVVPVEIFGETSEYQWDKVATNGLRGVITLFNNRTKEQVKAPELKARIFEVLDQQQPDAVAVNGWFDRSALIALYWCKVRKVRAILMSESTATDDKRVWWKEWIKKNVVSHFAAALVGGQRHAHYLNLLGIPSSKIFFGYDVVDNDYFKNETEKIRANETAERAKRKLPENYFLVVSRFIQKKNLPFVIDAYHQYFTKAGAAAWDLYILGDGELKTALHSQVVRLGLSGKVHFEGFKQYGELPAYFGLAKGLVHASTVEQWGLVVNEAMASALPVIISKPCGSVPELVHDGINGFAIDPYNQQQLADIIYGFSNGSYDWQQMGREGQRIVSNLSPDTFGKGIRDAAAVAVESKSNRQPAGASLLLKLLAAR
ncbi:glycosyltransferase [Pseudocnuella soli]|uniref:glycosyltransferase n=1 Tax=Pseudocnuella soli TaxID=2502779 RepID=UPI001052A7A1|nr:glycosyltransferase [Pseudocnuella soli]